MLYASLRVCLTFSFDFPIFGVYSVVFMWFFPKDCLYEVQLCGLEKFSVVKCSHQRNPIIAMWQQGRSAHEMNQCSQVGLELPSLPEFWGSIGARIASSRPTESGYSLGAVAKAVGSK